MDDGLNSLFHILHAYPFQPRMECVLPRENVGAGQPHKRKPRAVGAAPNGRLDGREPGATYRLHRMLDYLGMAVDHLLHIAVLLLDFQPVGRLWKVLHHFFDDAFQQPPFLLPSLVAEIAHDETDRGFLQRASDADRMQKTVLAFGGFGRAVILRKSIDDSRSDLDRMLHLPFGKS